MSLLKKNIFVLTLLLMVYGWFFVSRVLSPQSALVKVSGTSENVSLFIEPQAGRDFIVNAINNAQKEILVEVYLLSDKEIISALENAREKGVIVNVMVEQHPFGGGNVNDISSQELKNSGVSFKWTNPAFSLTHEKSIVIDNQETFILSQNLTLSSFSKNREYDILDTNQGDVSEVRNMFINDWERKNFNPPLSNLIICPINCRAGITTIINNATKSLKLEIEDINDNQIVSLLSEKTKTANVQIIVPTLSQINSNKKTLEKLLKAGVSVRTLSSPYIHAKLIIADGTRTYVGSVNLSSQSMDENRELGIILAKSDITNTLSSTFDSDWNKGKNLSLNN